MQHQMLWPGGDVARAAMAKAMPSVRVTQLPGPYLPPFLLFHLKILPPAHNRPSLLDSLPLPLRRCHRCCRTSQISFLFLSLSLACYLPLCLRSLQSPRCLRQSVRSWKGDYQCARVLFNPRSPPSKAPCAASVAALVFALVTLLSPFSFSLFSRPAPARRRRQLCRSRKVGLITQ